MRDERRDGEQGEHDGRRVGAGRSKRWNAVLDVQRQRLGLPEMLPGDDRDRAELAQAARGREDDAVDDAPADRRQRDAPERLQRDAPSVDAACSCSSPISRSTGTTSRTTNGSETKIVARTIAGQREDRPGCRASLSHGPNQPLRP